MSRQVEHPNLSQHRGMGNGPLNVVFRQRLVETYRSGELFDEGIGGFCEATVPEFLVVFFIHGNDTL